jgi:uncharacterized protein with PQ loop repeat
MDLKLFLISVGSVAGAIGLFAPMWAVVLHATGNKEMAEMPLGIGIIFSIIFVIVLICGIFMNI